MSRCHPTRAHVSVLLLALVLALAAAIGAPSSAAAQDADPVSEGAATDACRQHVGSPQQLCDTVRSFTHGIAATCRRVGAPEACTPLNGQRIAADEVVAYQGSATSAAHALQRALQEDLPLRHATFVATHNSYNSYVYRPTLSGMDANQSYSLSDQLRMDVRRLELDVHTWTDAMTGETAPILCHATSAGAVDHVGCTFEMTLAAGLAEIDGWLDANPDELVMLRVESHLDGTAGHDHAARVVRDVIGDHLFAPPAGSCTPLDLDLTRAGIRAHGQVLLVSSCGPSGSAWGPLVWDDGSVRVESTVRAQDFAYPHCAGIPRSGAVSYESRWIRFYDDATLVSSYASFGGTAPQRAVPATARQWTRCGVNQPSFDHLTPTDGRLAALLWTWAEGEGAAGDCAVISTATGSFASRPCDHGDLRYLCTTGHAVMLVTSSTGGPDGHADACAELGARPAVPRSGYEAQAVVDLAGAQPEEVWIALRRGTDGWTATV